ncbi:MAG: EAL domain-containing protein [Synechococcaceae cyanobacterium RL_1_2]|nr:EAL domain-containing protein [Synechococcaceae cyanobacterium RL_1_2]
MTFKAGECIFEEGDARSFAYIIEEGEIEIWRETDGNRVVLNVLKSGSMFGELALVDAQPRSASASARTDSILTLVTQEQVNNRIESSDPILRMLLLVVMRYFRAEIDRIRPQNKNSESTLDPKINNNLHLGSHLSPQDLEHRISEAVEMIRMESELQTAIHEGQFRLVYQPIINLETTEIAGFEALIRWQSPSRGFIRPDLFIPLAESTSLIIPIGQWIMRQALDDLKKIQTAGHDNLFMSLNIASRQIEDKNFISDLLQEVDRVGVKPAQVKLEIIERSLFDLNVSLPWVHQCREIGFPIVLDDFGTGYSSLQYLNQYNLDTIKVDRSFVMQMKDSKSSANICRTIVDLSKYLDMTAVAEGIEEKSHVDLLKEMGCGYGQGYYFAKPANIEECLKLF